MIIANIVIGIYTEVIMISYNNEPESHSKSLLSLSITLLIAVSIAAYLLYQKHLWETEQANLNQHEVKPLTKQVTSSPLLNDRSLPDIRNVKWGMTIEQVKAVESKPDFYQSSPNYLTGHIYVQGLYTSLGYTFKNQRLVEADLDFMDSGGQMELLYDNAIQDFNKVEKGLTRKYGNPFSRRIIKLKDRTTGDDAFDLSKGYIEYETIWKLRKTHITHQLLKNYELYHHLAYTQRSIALVREKKERANDDL